LKLVLLAGAGIALLMLGLDQVSEFYFRGESEGNVVSLSGRTFIAGALWSANTWQSLLLGNGYLMNTPDGLFFPVAELGTSMASPHDGFFAVLLGSGVVGSLLVLLMHVRCFIWFRKHRALGGRSSFEWTMPAYLFLTGITMFDYGVWGVTSPALLAFFVLYFTLWRIAKPAPAHPLVGLDADQAGTAVRASSRPALAGTRSYP
jgi:hypothetical protein